MQKYLYPLSIWAKVVASALVPPLTSHRRRILYGAYLSLRRKLPIISLDKVLRGMPDKRKLRLRVLETKPHNLSAIELFTLAAIAAKMQPEICLEIGTYDGRGTMALASNTRSRVYTINLPPGYLQANPAESQLIDVQLSDKVVSGARILAPEKFLINQVFGNSRDMDFSQFGTPDLIFIDGGHDYETAKSDTQNALKIVNKDRGIIVWDDAVHYGVGQYLPSLNLPIFLIDQTKLAILAYRAGRPVELTHEHIPSPP